MTARALEAAGQPRARAVALAEQACEAYRASGNEVTGELANIERWIEARRR